MKTDTEETNLPASFVALDRYLHHVEGVRYILFKIMLPVSERVLDDIKGRMAKLDEANELLRSENEQSVIRGIEIFEIEQPRIEYLMTADIPKILLHSIFISLFSAFDVLIGAFLLDIYTRKPALLKALNLKIDLSEVIEGRSIDAIRNDLLEAEISGFRRESYVKQFDVLESRFGLNLRKFENWPRFVEASQRRNLIVHNDGIVSSQYLEVCKSNGVISDKSTTVGTKLEISVQYLLECCDLVAEVAFKLVHTLWRKLLPNEIADSDEHLKSKSYTELTFKRWRKAQMIGEFALNLPQKPSDLHLRIMVVNLAIALDSSKQREKALAILDRMDWTAAIPEFKLAVAVLKEEYESAVAIMEKIGKKGELLSQEGYHLWPLFNKFRTTEVFQKAYEKIFTTPFPVALQKSEPKITTTDIDSKKLLIPASEQEAKSVQAPPDIKEKSES